MQALTHVFKTVGIALLFYTANGGAIAQAACSNCIEDDADVAKQAIRLSKLPPKEQLTQVRKTGTCVVILKSGRKFDSPFFNWQQVEAPQGDLREVSSQKNLMGKTLCKGERPISKSCTTIVLAADAPVSTLVHEYLHTRQIAKDPEWCAFSKALWGRPARPADIQRIRDKEWDVHRFLWLNREALRLGVEDDLAVTAELVEEAQARKGWDESAETFIGTQKVREHLMQAMQRYQDEVKDIGRSKKTGSK